jgi:RHS repeat-associated protein
MPTVRYTTINGEIVAEKRNSVRSLYVPDPLGSTVALLDNTQTQTDQWSCMPYGETTRIKGSNPTPFVFVGTKGYRQDTTTRTYVRARSVEPLQGRWMTEDPVWRSAPEVNIYTYAGGRPTSSTDRTGLQTGKQNGDLIPSQWPAPKPPNYVPDPVNDPGFNRSRSRTDCNDHYGTGSYCSCQCQCRLQTRTLGWLIWRFYDRCLKGACIRDVISGCKNKWLSDGGWLDRLDDACRAECLKDHRPPGQVGNPDTGPCQWVN